MCHGEVDLKVLERELADRVAQAAPASRSPTEATGVPPELMGGLRGVWARVCAGVARHMGRGRGVAAR